MGIVPEINLTTFFKWDLCFRMKLFGRPFCKLEVPTAALSLLGSIRYKHKVRWQHLYRTKNEAGDLTRNFLHSTNVAACHPGLVVNTIYN